MAEPIRLVFMGSDPVALPLLDWLAGEGGVAAILVGVVTGPDRPSGRGQAVKANPVKAWAAGRQIALLQPEKLDGTALSSLTALRPDVTLVVAYGHILREAFISVPRLGTLNLHASLLPRYRGASPIQTAVAVGDQETGMTLMRIVRELDAGPVADVERVKIARLDTASEVESKLSHAAVPLMERALPALARGDLEFREQDHASAIYCRKLEKSDSGLDFSAPASVLASRVNGLNPWPSVTVEIEGASVKLGLADFIADGSSGVPGLVTGCDGEGVLVSTGAGVLRMRRFQRPGGRMMDASAFLRGFPITKGTVLRSKPMNALVSPIPFKR